MFWATTIFDGLIQLPAIFLLSETYAPVILRRRFKKRSRHTDSARQSARSDSHGHGDVLKQLANAFKWPLFLLATQPVLQATAVYSAYSYGLMYLMLATFPDVWTDYYHERTSIAGLNYLSLTVGFAVGEFGTATAQDLYYKSRTKKTEDKKGRPEFRLPLLVPAALLLPVGLFWFVL